jgi:hypothetical protein
MMEYLTADKVPLVLAMTPNAPELLPMDISLAFVNPFSENQDLAVKFMEELASGLDVNVQYLMFPDLTEPVKNSYYEESIESVQGYIASLEEALENAEPKDVQALEEELANAYASLESVKENIYSMTEKDIEWFRSHSQGIVFRNVNWLYQQEDASEMNDLSQQYIDGLIDANQFMTQLDRKVRMMLMEGY